MFTTSKVFKEPRHISQRISDFKCSIGRVLLERLVIRSGKKRLNWRKGFLMYFPIFRTFYAAIKWTMSSLYITCKKPHFAISSIYEILNFYFICNFSITQYKIIINLSELIKKKVRASRDRKSLMLKTVKIYVTGLYMPGVNYLILTSGNFIRWNNQNLSIYDTPKLTGNLPLIHFPLWN